MYRITFKNEEVWMGGEPDNSNWNKMPNKPIKKIEYTLWGHTVIFEGYEAYNHLRENTHFFLKENQARISKVFLMAKKGNVVYSFVFDYFNKEIITTSAEFGKEYYGKDTKGWKEGLKDTETKYSMVKDNSSG